MSIIQPIHTEVPGRARFKIEGLYHCQRLKSLLEIKLAFRKEILQVSANTTTGNLLVRYNSGNDHWTIGLLIEAFLNEAGFPAHMPARHETQEPTLAADPHVVGSPGADDPSHASVRVEQEPCRRRADEPEWKTAAGRLAPAREQAEEDWHIRATDFVIARVDSDKKKGLSSAVAAGRLKELGANTLPEAGPRSTLSFLVSQFKSLPVALLGAAAGLSVFTGGVVDGIIIMGVVVLNAAIGCFIERQADRTIHALKHVVHPHAHLIRDGGVTRIPSEEVVPGDLLVLKPGTYVSADSRLLFAERLHVDESALTGESLPATKGIRTLRNKHIPLADRKNMVYMGTVVTGGTGLAVAVHTGSLTEIGRLQSLLQETTSPQTPLERQLGKIGNELVLLSVAVCGAVFGIGFLRGYGVLQMGRTAISLAAAAVPEGLPAAATMTLGLGIRRMREHRILVRELKAVETLGAVQTICLDKTGTVTWNRMSVQRIFSGGRRIHVNNGQSTFDGGRIDLLNFEEIEQLIRVCVLCSETEIEEDCENGKAVLRGSPTEKALIRLATEAGIDPKELRKSHRLLKVTLRSENRLHMATIHLTPRKKGRLYAVKGSPNEVLAMCNMQMVDGRRVPLSGEDRVTIETENEHMAGRALRVLGVACGWLDRTPAGNVEEGLTWLGLVGMADPIRDGVKDLIQVFHKAGIETVMITGDQSPTAYAVAKDLRLGREDRIKILDSSELSSVEPEVMQALAKEVQVFSRVTPSHKLRIVQALQAAGRTVAMTGDGINDGPALKAADIGIAMGKSGTDIAREVADIVLERDNLETLIEALRDGRTTYINIRKSIRFFFSTNLSEMIVMVSALTAGIGAPLNAMQLLWINILSDIFPGLALSLEAPEPDVLNDPPRDAGASLFTRKDYLRIARESALISGAALAAYGYGIAKYGMGARAGTLAFHGLTIGQLLHALSCRSEKHTLWDNDRPPANRYLYLALGGSLVLQMLTMVVPGLRRFLGLTSMNAMDMAVVAGSALLPLALNEAAKKTTKAQTNEK